jgi:hypothetical protein
LSNDTNQVTLSLLLSLLFVAYIISLFAISGCSLLCALHQPEWWGQHLIPHPHIVSAGLALATLTISLGLRKTKLILSPARHVFNRIEKSFLICAVGVALLACASSLVVSNIVLKTFPNSADEFVYLFQAQTLLQGRIWNPPPPIPHIFSAWHIIETTDIWVGKWPPGWPGIIALFSGIGVKAWMVNPALNGLTALLIAYLGRQIRGIPFLIGLLFYNDAITGNALLAPQMIYDGVGGGVWRWWGLSDANVRVYSNIIELVDWTSARILTIYFIFLFPVFLVGMAFYNADAGNRYGPRYLFEAYPFLVLTCGSGLSLVIERLQERRSALAASAVFLCILGLIGGSFESRSSRQLSHA